MKAKCNQCHSTDTVKRGHQIRWKGGFKHKIQMHQCKHCGHQFNIGEIS